MGEHLRVTMIATGLGSVQAHASQHQQQKPRLEMVETVIERTGTDNAGIVMTESIDYDKLDQPAVVRRRQPGQAREAAFDSSDIPAFLRKQAD